MVKEPLRKEAGSLLKFFSLTYAVTWTCFIAAAAVSADVPARGGVYRPLLFLLGVFGPSLVALWLTVRAEGRMGVIALLRRLFESRVNARWYIFAIGYMATIKLAVALVHRLTTGTWPLFGQTPFYIMAGSIILSTPVQAGEEIGWRAYALPRLAERLRREQRWPDDSARAGTNPLPDHLARAEIASGFGMARVSELQSAPVG